RRRTLRGNAIQIRPAYVSCRWHPDLRFAGPILFGKENPMTRRRGILIAALFALFATGCFEVEQSIELKRDLSGTANFKLGIDMEPMITIMAKVQKEMGGDKSPLTKAEIAAAKADFKKNEKKSTTTTEDPRKEAEGGL